VMRRRLEFAWPGPGPGGEVVEFEHAGFKIRLPRRCLAAVCVACPGSGPALAERPF
jgi:hypothetical protein